MPEDGIQSSESQDCIFCLVDVLSVVQVSNIRDKDGRVISIWQYGSWLWACINMVIIGVVSLQSCTDIADQVLSFLVLL